MAALQKLAPSELYINFAFLLSRLHVCLSLQDFTILMKLDELCKSQSSFLFNISYSPLNPPWYKNRNENVIVCGELFIVFQWIYQDH